MMSLVLKDPDDMGTRLILEMLELTNSNEIVQEKIFTSRQ